MVEEKRINIELIKPRYPIGRTIYVPQTNKPIKTNILGYDAEIGKVDGNLLGAVIGYHISHFVFVKRGDDSVMTSIIKKRDFYVNKKRAQKASRFLEVKVDDEIWRLAIGDREIEDANSPYHINNCDFSPCCANISEARDVLIYCREQGGLIVHYRNELLDLLEGHGYGGDHMERIMEQLKLGE